MNERDVSRWHNEALMWWDTHRVTLGRDSRQRADFALRYALDCIAGIARAPEELFALTSA